MKRVVKARVLLGVVVAVGLLVGSIGVAAQPTAPFALDRQVDADTVIIRIDLHQNTTATWTLEYWVRLQTDNETAAFDSLEADIAANRSAYEDRFGDRMRSTVRTAENATGREMAVRDVSVRTERREIPERFGLVIYQLDWTAFATASGDQLHVGDAISGLYLTDQTTLILNWPAEYRASSIQPQADESSSDRALWRGPENFGDDEPRIILTAGSPTPTDSGPGPATQGPTEEGGFPIAILLGGLLVLAALGAGGWLLRSRGTVETGPATDQPATDAEAASGTPHEDLLSNEERVLRLMQEHGGRMKQQAVAQELGWTDAKTSQVVGELREAGDLDGFRLGRENVLSLPDENDGGEDQPSDRTVD